MAKRLTDARMAITQKTVGFYSYQREFFIKYPDFKPDRYCRIAIDEQIKLIDPEMIPYEKATN
jgi:hypothetical protein